MLGEKVLNNFEFRETNNRKTPFSAMLMVVMQVENYNAVNF